MGEDNADPSGFDPAQINFLLLTHAHLDQCERIPLLVKRGFKGQIITIQPTRELTRLVLMDSAHLQSEEFRRWQRKDHDSSTMVVPVTGRSTHCCTALSLRSILSIFSGGARFMVSRYRLRPASGPFCGQICSHLSRPETSGAQWKAMHLTHWPVKAMLPPTGGPLGE